MFGTSWSRRTALCCGVLLGVVAVALVVLRLLGLPVAGVELEALVLTAMMTAPFTLGFLLLLVLAAAGLERLVRGRR